MVDIDENVRRSSIRYLNTLDGYIFEPYVNIADGRIIHALASLYDETWLS